MKLRRKIIIIVCAAILAALSVSDAVICKVCFDTLHKEALNAAYADSHEKAVGFDGFVDSVKGTFGAVEAKYYFESLHDSYTVCIRDNELLYNRTVISPEELKDGEFRAYNDMSYKEYRAAGRKLIIFRHTGKQSTELYRIVDITYIYEKIEKLCLFMLVVLFTVSVLCGGTLFVFLRRVLSPLYALSKSARAVTEGNYKIRITASTDDEIGYLAHDFNKMAQAVEERTDELVDSQRRKTMFIGALTHELKTPLAAISGYAQTLRAVCISDDERDEALEYIYEEACRLDRLSKKLMRLLKLEHDNELAMADVPIRELLLDAMKICASSADEKGVSIKIGDAHGVLFCERDLMCEVLVNLIDNAIKASPRDSQILLYSDGCGINVRDFGCGISKDDIPNLCEPFYTADASRSSKNVGLGLTLVDIILDSHSMKLKVESRVGEGSIFCLIGENFRRS